MVRSDIVRVVVSTKTEPAEVSARVCVIVACVNVGTTLLAEGIAGTFTALASAMLAVFEDAARLGHPDWDRSCVETVSVAWGGEDSPVEICQIEV